MSKQKSKKVIKAAVQNDKGIKSEFKTKGNGFFVNIDKFYFIFIMGFILAVYLQVVNFTYTGFDDDFLIVNNMQTLMDAKFVDVFAGNSFLTDAVSGFYRPAQTITFITDAQIGNGSLWAFHFTNLFLYIISCLLIYRLLRKFEFDGIASLIATLIFSLHPIFSINVAWLPARGDLLIAVFGLAAFIQFINYLESKKSIHLILHFLFLLLAFFSKETAVLIPMLIYSYYIIFYKKLFDRILVLPLILWIIGIWGWVYLRFEYSGSLPENQIFGFIPFIENLRTIPEYISKFILPVNLMSLPVFTLFTTSFGIIIVSLILIFSLKIKSYFEKFGMTDKKISIDKKYIIFGALWFLLSVLPGMLYSRYYPKSEMFYHYLDHRAFLPLLGILIILIVLLRPILNKFSQKKIFLYGIIITMFLSIYSFFNVKTFSNPKDFLDNAIEDNPKAAVVYFLRGNYYKDEADFSSAINDYTRAVAIDRNYAEAYNNRGSAYGLLGDYHKSIMDLTKAIALEPNIPDGFFNRGIARDATGDLDGAVKDFTKSIAITPNDFLVYYLRANTFSKLGMRNEALEDFTVSIRLNNSFPDAYVNRGVERYKINDKSGACSDWQIATELGSPQAKQMLERYCGNK